MATIEILQALQSEVGSRRAGTAGERQAQEWLKARCESLGLPVELDEYTFIGSERYHPLLQLITLVWATTTIGLSFTGQPLLGAVGFFLLFYYDSVVHKKLEMRLARTRSQNVIAGLRRPISEYVVDPDKGPAFLICAHYDTPRNRPAWYSKVSGMDFLHTLGLLGIVVYVVFMALRGLGWLVGFLGVDGPRVFLADLSPWVGCLVLIMAAPTLMLKLFDSLTALVSKKTDCPGADDNGSGIALVLELARRLKEKPPENFEVFFAWWGAEECGHFGSRQFVRRFDDQFDFDKDMLYLINADAVGVGELLTVYPGQGVIRRRAADLTTVERIERIAARLGVKTIRSWESIISGGSSDHAEWVDRGYNHVISLLRENYRPVSFPARLLAALLRIPHVNQLDNSWMHSPDDTIEVINPQVLEETTDMAEAYVREIDGEFHRAGLHSA
jgi:hypothetical protein